MKKTALRIFFLFSVMMCSVLFLSQSRTDYTAFAGKTLQENRNEVSRLENTLDSKKDDIAHLQRQIDEAKRNVAQQANVKHLLDTQIEEIEEQITLTKQLIEEYELQIGVKETDIATIDSNISDALGLIRERLVIQHETGNSSMISFILGSEDFAEMLTRIEIANELFEYDKEIIEDLSRDRDALALAHTELSTLLEKCKETEETLETTEADLEIKVTDATAYLNTLKQDEKFLEDAKAKKEKELLDIQNEVKELMKKIELQEREDFSNQEFRFPLAYDAWYVNTGNFGWRVWDSGRATDYHKGVDFAAYRGTPIYAVNSGVVTISRLSPSFGNYVVIDHGGGISSLYAHASKRLVEVGDKVTKGDKIAEVGSTGDSTGNHLHFAILKNGEYVDPMNYISEPK